MIKRGQCSSFLDFIPSWVVTLCFFIHRIQKRKIFAGFHLNYIVGFISHGHTSSLKFLFIVWHINNKPTRHWYIWCSRYTSYLYHRPLLLWPSRVTTMTVEEDKRYIRYVSLSNKFPSQRWYYVQISVYISISASWK